jgi:endonuclease/exonuclease/phosphatase (EEP) superfamily protein YafD
MAASTAEPALGKRKPRSRLWTYTLANAAWVLVLYLSHTYIAERFWLSMFLTYCPQLLFLLPSVVLVGFCTRGAARPQLLLNVAALLFGLWGVAGMVLHPFHEKAGPGAIRVMTYNVEGGKVGYDKVAATVLRQHPDVLCLMEAGNMHGTLQAMLPEYGFCQEGGIAIASRLPVLASRWFPLPPGQHALAVDVNHDGERIEVVAVHLVPTNIDHDAFHGPGAIAHSMARTSRAHRTQIGALLEGTLPVPGKLVLCGDFNAPPYGWEYSLLRDHFADAFADTGSGFGYTVPAVAPFIRIDFVFCNGRMKPLQTWVPSDISSDHRAVVCDMQ